MEDRRAFVRAAQDPSTKETPHALHITSRLGATLIDRKGEDVRLLAFAWALERGMQAQVTPAEANDQ